LHCTARAKVLGKTCNAYFPLGKLYAQHVSGVFTAQPLPARGIVRSMTGGWRAEQVDRWNKLCREQFSVSSM